MSSSRGSLSSKSTQNRSGHQLSDSGHHEDLSPGGKRRISTKEKGCTFFERLSIKGHDVELLVDDEDLLGVCPAVEIFGDDSAGKVRIELPSIRELLILFIVTRECLGDIFH